MSYHPMVKPLRAPLGADILPPSMTPTKAQVMAFQTAMGIKADGIVGPETIAALARAGLSLAALAKGENPFAPPPPAPRGMSNTTKTVLIVGGVGVGVLLLSRLL